MVIFVCVIVIFGFFCELLGLKEMCDKVIEEGNLLKSDYRL